MSVSQKDVVQDSRYHTTRKFFTQYCLDTEMQKAVMAGNITRMNSMQNCSEKTVWKSREWEDNIKLYFKTGV
jgi:hypothetical protein